MKQDKMSIGLILIILGVVLLFKPLFNINIFDMAHFWPIFVLGPGLVFEGSFFLSKKNPGLLVPGGILTTIGSLFFFETFTDWNFAGYTWPVYILAVAIGLYQLYLFDGRSKALLIPVGILTTVGLVSLILIIFGNIFVWLNSSIVWAILFILLGVFILIKNYIIK